MDVVFAPLRHRARPTRWLVAESFAALVYGLFTFAVLGMRAGNLLLATTGTIVASAVLITARRSPIPSAAAALAVFWLTVVSNQFSWIALLPLAYALYRIAERHRLSLAGVALVAGLSGPFATLLPSFQRAGAVVPFSLVLLAAWTVGVAVREHRRYTAHKVVSERVRIARDLHDVIAHSISVITVQAAYGRLVVDREPAAAAEALATIETIGRQSLVELRQVLQVLRTSPDLNPAPGLDDVRQLVEQTEAAGVTVDLTMSGEPISAGMELSLYRLLQESLTNVVKHAKTDLVWVTVAATAGAVELVVTDRGRGCAICHDGHGITGMRERVALYGGTLSAGPRDDGGFEVRAHLPIASML